MRGGEPAPVFEPAMNADNGGGSGSVTLFIRSQVAGGPLRGGELTTVRRSAKPQPTRRDSPALVDCGYEYKRVSCQLMMCERLRGWRHVIFTERRTRQDFAHCIRGLVDGQYPRATKI